MTQEAPDWQRHRQAALTALRAGQFAAAQSALSAGFAAAGAAADGSDRAAPVPLILVQLDLFLGAGDLEQAEALFAAQAQITALSAWLWYKGAEVALARDTMAEAWARLATGQAVDPDGQHAAPRLLAARLWQAEGQGDRAKAVLRGLARVNPNDVQALSTLARLEAEAGHLRAAATLLAEARTRAPERVDFVLLQGRYLTEAGQAAQAIALYEAFQAEHGVQIEVTLRCVAACRALGKMEQVSHLLTQAIAIDPLNPQLLRDIFRSPGQAAGHARMAAVLEQLSGRIDPDLQDDLAIQMHLARAEYRPALRLLRRTKQARRDAVDAQNMASALIGAGQFDLGLRYLRFCLRRWPRQTFLNPYIYQALRLGRMEEAAAMLERVAPSFPTAVLHKLRFTLAGYQGNFAAAQAAYQVLDQLGALNQDLKMQLARMIFIWLDPFEADAFFAQIPHPFEGSDKPLHRGGLPGQMMQEYELERRALPQDGTRWSPLDWMQARPGSTMAAIRLVDAWRAGDLPWRQEAGEPIPQQIFQYWDAQTPPPEVQEACATWASVPGYAHTLYNRSTAFAYLRDHFEPGFLQAFRLAQNSAQEADFLRLCLLSREGGIWADVDDQLYGKLETVLDEAKGLILFREPQGAALGNNFMAAPPGHPVIRHAARLASMALRRRDNETTWSKTGPGLLTRAVGHYLARKEAEREAARITVLDWPQVARHIGMHNLMPYKRTPVHWNAEAMAQHAPVWDQLLEHLQ